jgi:plastocyanin
MTRRRVLALAAIALVALAAGCGGADSTPVATTHVSMAKSYRFSPKVIQVDRGSTVTWTDDDNFTHTVKFDGQDDHEVGRGDSISITFARAGTFHYVCTLHSRDMSGEVIVT